MFCLLSLKTYPQGFGNVSVPGRPANIWWQLLHGQKFPAEKWQCFFFPRIFCTLAVPLSVRFLARKSILSYVSYAWALPSSCL